MTVASMTIIEPCSGHLFLILLENIDRVPTFVSHTVPGIVMNMTDTVPILTGLTDNVKETVKSSSIIQYYLCCGKGK